MKRGRILENICRTWLILVIGMCVGCGKNEAVDSDSGAETVKLIKVKNNRAAQKPKTLMRDGMIP